MASEQARQRYARKNEQDELERAFRAIDKNGDGRIDAEELAGLFKSLGHTVRDHTASIIRHAACDLVLQAWAIPVHAHTACMIHSYALATGMRNACCCSDALF